MNDVAEKNRERERARGERESRVQRHIAHDLHVPLAYHAVRQDPARFRERSVILFFLPALPVLAHTRSVDNSLCFAFYAARGYRVMLKREGRYFDIFQGEVGC